MRNSKIMLPLLRLIFISILSLSIFILLGQREMQAPKENISPAISGEASSSVISKTCIKNPHIEFFMYHYIRDHDGRDNAIVKELSVSPALFEEHMKKIVSLREQKRITLIQ
jgi:hypothetical protein